MNSSDIAKLAGVSRSTVSRVINGYSNVPDNTRERVLKVIEEHGYTPNSAARSLAGKPNNIVGLFIVENAPENTNIIQSSPFYAEFLADIADKLRHRDFHLLVSIIQNDREMQSAKNLFAQKVIAAGIFMGDIVPESTLAWFSKHGYPAMLVNQREEIDLDGILLLNTENYMGAYNAVSVLVNHGHRRIAHITGALEKVSAAERYRGYRDCLEKNGIPFDESIVVNANMHREDSGYNAAKQLFLPSKDNLPTAIFALNDLMAFGAIRALTELGFKVPQDVSIIGFDNVKTSSYTTPALSTVSASVDKLAELAADSLIGYLEAKPDVPTVLRLDEFEIIMRNSVAAIHETP